MDLALLRPLYDVVGSEVVSVHLDTSREDQDADKRLELTWRSLRRDLAEQGVGAQTLAALDGEVGAAPHIAGPQGESVFAADGRILGAFVLSRPPVHSRAVVGPVADPMETVLDLDHQLPYAVVALDRAGGDIEAFPAGAYDPATRRVYDGTTLHLTRVRAGGPSMAAYHRRARNAWRSNAAGVAQEAAEAANSVGADVVFVGGDPKAVPLLREEIAALGLDVELVEVSGGRGREDTAAVLREAVEEALAERSRSEHEQAMIDYRDALGQGGAVHGLPAVAAALAQGGVERLLLAADRRTDPERWAAVDDGKLMGSVPEALGPHAGSAFQAGAGPLMLRAATAGDAAFSELLPDVTADDGCAAILRFDTRR